VAEWSALRKADYVVAVDSLTALDYVERYPWLRDRIRIIPNGVDTNTFLPMNRDEARKRWGLVDAGTVFLYAGRLEADKNVSQIIRAFKELHTSGSTLVIAGDGSERSTLEEVSGGHGILFLGSVPRTEMASLINAADATVLFSDEGLSSFALEALACGVPVITTPSGDLPALIHRGENGYLVTNSAELVDALQRVARRELGPDLSIVSSVASHAWPEVGRRLLGVYREVWDSIDS
jgi:glycosyltransferase involved in cell wall biosynthesis